MENLLNSLGMPCSSFFQRWSTVSPRAALSNGYVQGEGKGSTNPIKVSRENFPTNLRRACGFPGNARAPLAGDSRQISENKPNRKRFLEGFEGVGVGDIPE
jgi:hypothetical protein